MKHLVTVADLAEAVADAELPRLRERGAHVDDSRGPADGRLRGWRGAAHDDKNGES